jgi:hypothetical protein
MFMITLIERPKIHFTKTVKWENDLREATFTTPVSLPVADQPIKKGNFDGNKLVTHFRETNTPLLLIFSKFYVNYGN